MTIRLIDDIHDELEAATEFYQETYAQYKAEIGLLGDAWSGANDDVTFLSGCVNRLQAELEDHPDYVPFVPTPMDIFSTSDLADEIPF